MNLPNSNTGRDWRSILLTIGSVGVMIVTVILAITVVVYQAATMLTGSRKSHPLFDSILLAITILFIGALLIPSAYYSIRHLMGKDVPPDTTPSMSFGQGALIVAGWLVVIALTQLLYGNTFLRWLTPPLYLASIGLPVYFFVRLTTGGLNAGSRLRTWGAFSTGMILSPSIASFVELTVIGFLAAGVGIYLAFHPELFGTFNALRGQISNASTPNDIFNLIGPYLLNPWVIVVGLFLLSVVAPLVEETSKSLTAWILFDHLSSPAQGFIIGALSGTGFGLVESLMASVQPDSSWATTLIVRGGSTMMHIVTASLTGWGIASFRATKRPRRMIGMYALAMLLHSLWNASVVAIAVGATDTSLGLRANGFVGFWLMAIGVSILCLIALSIPFALGTINWRLRTASSPAQPAADLPYPIPMEEKKNGDGTE